MVKYAVLAKEGDYLPKDFKGYNVGIVDAMYFESETHANLYMTTKFKRGKLHERMTIAGGAKIVKVTFIIEEI